MQMLSDDIGEQTYKESDIHCVVSHLLDAWWTVYAHAHECVYTVGRDYWMPRVFIIVQLTVEVFEILVWHVTIYAVWKAAEMSDGTGLRAGD